MSGADGRPAHSPDAWHSFGSSSWQHSSSVSSTNPSSLPGSSLPETSRSQPLCLPYPVNIRGLENGFQPVTTVFLILMVSLYLSSGPAAQNEIRKVLETLSGTGDAQIQELDEDEAEEIKKKKKR